MKSKAGITSCIINKRPSVASATMSEEVRFSLLEKSVSAEFQADFTSYPQGLVRGDPGRFVLTQKYADSVDIFRNFPVRSDDVWVVTFPKCGTTWTQEMVWMITHDCDLEAAKEKLQVRSPFIEWPTLPQTDSPVLMDFQKIEAMPSPRVLKSHLPFYLLPPRLADTCKVVYVARNPKDVIVSYFHHHQIVSVQNFTSDIEKFAEYFMNDELYYSPFFAHILEGWAKREHPNVLFLFYEDMKRNLRGEIEKVCTFLGKTLSEQQLELLTRHLHFDSVSKNTAINFMESKADSKEPCKFIRKGMLRGTPFQFKYSPMLNHLQVKLVTGRITSTRN